MRFAATFALAGVPLYGLRLLPRCDTPAGTLNGLQLLPRCPAAPVALKEMLLLDGCPAPALLVWPWPGRAHAPADRVVLHVSQHGHYSMHVNEGLATNQGVRGW